MRAKKDRYILEKKALSPIIASVLLVSIAIVLAVIIFFWARSFVSEAITKSSRNIAQLCEEVNFRAEAFIEVDGKKINIENLGNVPLYGVEIKKKKLLGDIREVAVINEGTITAGETARVNLPDPQNQLQNGDTISVSPVLLGETETHKKTYVCEEQAIEITIN